MDQKYTKTQLWFLVILRVAIGWHFLYEGIIKLMNPNWSSVGYLMDSRGWFSGLFHAIAGNTGLLEIIDFLNIWGLILIGLALLLGLFTRIAYYGGIALLAMYYLSHPPFINAVYAIPAEGTYMLINKNLIELLTLIVLLVFPTSKIIGLDRFISKKRVDG
ncbi:MAG: DoxX family membrane protein [Bacteroidales bacterium]|nr:DoxX family membrane protein [Bacteroidales bacterium]